MALFSKIRKKRAEIPERDRSDRPMLGRTFILLVVCGVLMFIPLTAVLFRLMIVRHDELGQMAIDNQTRSTRITASRGTIYDRNMDVLSVSVPSVNVFLEPNALRKKGQDIPAIAAGLSRILDVSEETILRLASDTSVYYKTLKKQISEETADRLMAYLSENGIVGIRLEPETRRSYPQGSLASQVLGFVNADNVGAEGLEARYNSVLTGIPGEILRTKGAGSSEMRENYEFFLDGETGSSLILTLDSTVQYYLEKNMENAMERYDIRNGAFGIVMNVNTGEILAMATLGGYDPNSYLEIYDPEAAAALEAQRLAYRQLTEGTEAYETARSAYSQALTAARQAQWRNRCTSDGYEPGSTFKLITLASALEEGTTTLNDAFFCGGSTSIKGRTRLLNCWRSTGHGAESTAQALQNSCNIAFAQIGIRLGGEKFYEYVQRFGLTEPTGVDLYGEASGYFFRKSLLTDEKSYASLTSGAFGQTFKVTPMQLVRAIAAVVNGGYVLQPYLVSEILDASGETVEKHEPVILRQVISERTSETMRGLMESVVTDGTAKNGAVTGYRIGGKTGTSEKLDVFDGNGQPVRDRIVSFVGVAPIDDPQYLVLVALDTPSQESGVYISGGQMAAPTVRDVLADILPYLGIEPDYSDAAPGSFNVTVPDVTGMTEYEAGKALSESGLGYTLRGNGRSVTGQIPNAGAEIPHGAKILIFTEGELPTGTVTLPDLSSLSPAEADDCLRTLGLYLQTKGAPRSDSEWIAVTGQDIAPGTEVRPGTTVTAELTDRSLLD